MIKRLLLCVSLALAGCQTAPVQPAIGDFSAAVRATANTVERRYARDDIEGLLANEYDEAVVDQQAFYELENCAAPIGLSVPIGDPGLTDFSEHCGYRTLKIENGDIVPAFIELEDGLPGITGENAMRLSSSLGAYAEALDTLARSNAPAELGRNFDSAAAAVLNLVDDAKRLGPEGEGLSRPTANLADAGAGLGSTLLREYFETKRYRLLQKLVEQSDPAVQLSSRAIAGWYRSQTSEEILAAYNALDAANGAQQRAIVALRNGGSREEAIAATRDLRLAYDQLAQMENNAPWRVHLAIAEAHVAMVEAFRQPQSIDALARANERIDNLVIKTKAFVDAIGDLEQENAR
ncbi:hypothetical protein [Pontixanthobacter aquaemixtae]|uniref:Imelysin-like domain-containing protein n=1 Tax=Pontixanthobacter aquaemixtae TaxID=1958940 RepID=A0A844ZUP4_9SPHN|nr:hypothetical protein [Pontixanthobacter aquaemixtae]MXO90850.1 hypothetical protein [Pontixanthobacter aquaemixtae]